MSGLEYIMFHLGNVIVLSTFVFQRWQTISLCLPKCVGICAFRRSDIAQQKFGFHVAPNFRKLSSFMEVQLKEHWVTVLITN